MGSVFIKKKKNKHKKRIGGYPIQRLRLEFLLQEFRLLQHLHQ